MDLEGLELSEKTLTEADLEALKEEVKGMAWWEDERLSASAHLFYASAISFYLKDGRLKASAQQVVESVSDMLRSTGLPKARGEDVCLAS